MVVLTGGHVIYASKDSQMILRGDMLQLEVDGSITNLTEQVRNTAVATQLKELKADDMIFIQAQRRSERCGLCLYRC